MKNVAKTLYLWDLADTLFGEDWNVEKTGLADFDAYIESLGYDLKTIDARTYEWHYERPFKDGLIELSILPGFVETLTWTKNNAVFSTGNPEQIQWRAEVFLKKGLPDILGFFQKIYSTFDYGNTNHKTAAMFLDILEKEAANGYSTIVYSDNKLENCRQFQQAADQAPSVQTRLYHVKAANGGLQAISQNFFEIPNLLELLRNEQKLAMS
jgi:hypothetical protein